MTAFSAAFSQIPTQHYITSTKGNIELTVSNNGIVGFNPVLNKSGFVWPRGSNAQYLYGGGFVLIRSIVRPEPSTYYSEFSYNPNDAKSWFAPGSVDDGDTLRPDLASKYRVYTSLDYDNYSGIDLNDAANPRWPIWTADDYLGAYYGEYKVDESERSRAMSKVKIMSDEDIVSIYKDTDKKVNTGAIINKNLFPVGVDAQTRVYSFDNENQKNTIFLNWIFTNKKGGLIQSITLAPVFDIDITKTTNAFAGIDNDIVIFPKDTSYITFATKMEVYEEGESFGYISFKWIQLPTLFNIAVDYDNPDRYILDNYGFTQIVPLINLQEMSPYFYERYKDTSRVGDKKFFMPVNHFNIYPNQSASFVLQINMTPPNADYPEMDEETMQKIEAELEANEKFFKERLTSVEVAEELSPISVFPNPTLDGNISVELGLPIGEQMTIELFDLSGNAIGTLYQGMHHTQNYDLKVDKRAKGTYLLRFTVGDKSYSKKFVVGG